MCEEVNFIKHLIHFTCFSTPTNLGKACAFSSTMESNPYKSARKHFTLIQSVANCLKTYKNYKIYYSVLNDFSDEFNN